MDNRNVRDNNGLYVCAYRLLERSEGNERAFSMQFIELLQWLVKQDAMTVQQWLDEVWNNQRPVPNDFNWRHFAAAIDTLAKSGQGDNGEFDRAWANVAISIYLYLINKAEAFERIELQDRMMELKIYFMLRFGNVTGDPILDIQQVPIWFFENLHIPLAEVQEHLKSLEKLDHEELLQLRLLKNRLSRIQILMQKQRPTFDKELENWIAIRLKLP